MKGSIILFITLCSLTVFAQVVDEVRLGYDESELTSKQAGMAVSPDGKYIAFAYRDKTIKIFDVDAGKFGKRFKGPYDELFDVHLTADKKLVLINKKEVQLWDWKAEKHIVTFQLLEEATKSSFSQRHNLLAVGQYEGHTAIFDLGAGRLIRVIPYKKHHVSALAFHPDGKSIVIGVMAAMNSLLPLKLFDILSGDEIASSGTKDFFTMAAFNAKGDKLVAWGRSGNNLYDGSDLSHIMKVGSDNIQSAGRNMAYGALIAGERILMLTDTRAFNVSEFPTGRKFYTTLREEVPRGLGRIGIGSFHIYPLNQSAGKVIINGTGNNINQIYDVGKNSMIGYFFSDSNDDFAIVCRDGRVEGTASALAKVYWTARKSDQKKYLESTFEKGYTPKLLSQIIEENNAQQITFEVDNILGNIPEIELKSISARIGKDSSSFESSQKHIKLEIAVKKNPQEVTAIKLFQNSKMVKSLSNDGKSNYTFDVSLTNSFGEENYIFVTAGSKAGVDSEKLKLTVTYKGATDAKPRLFLITIGINSYKNPKYDLNYAQADADGVYQLIKEKSNTLFQEIISHTIRNDSAIKTNILSALEKVKSTALEQDMLMLYYAGHGVMSEGIGRDKDFFIVPHDVTQLYGRDEILFEKAISANELRAMTQQINAQKQVFILDACQSSGALEAIESKNRGLAEEKAIAQLARSTGTFWITSTGTDQFASEFAKLGHGIFTYALLEGMQGSADANGDQRLTVRELSTYIENQVPDLSEQLKGSPQYPAAYSFGNDFPLIVYNK